MSVRLGKFLFSGLALASLALTLAIALGPGAQKASADIIMSGQWDPTYLACTCPLTYAGCFCIIIT